MIVRLEFNPQSGHIHISFLLLLLMVNRFKLVSRDMNAINHDLGVAEIGDMHMQVPKTCDI